MREYGQIQTCFWSNYDIQQLSDQAKLLATYLMTGPHSNGLGCYRLPDGYVQDDLIWPSETVSKRFGELFQIGFSKRCERTKFVFIPKFLFWNPIANPNVAKSRIKEFETVSKNFTYYRELCESIKQFGNHLPNGFINRIETVCRTVSKQNPTLSNPTHLPYQEGNIPPRLVSTSEGES